MKNRLLVLGMCFLFAFSSCKKDEETPAIVDGVNLENPNFSKNDTIQVQKDVEATGNKMLTELKSMNQEPGIQASLNLMSLMDSSQINKNVKNSVAFKTLATLVSLKGRNGNITHVMKSLEKPKTISVSDSFDIIAGIYTYNFATESFDQQLLPDSKAVIIKFPASKASFNSQLLDGQFKISKPTFKTGPFDFDGETIAELPTSFGFELSVNSQALVSYTFNATYNNDGLPTSVVSALTISTWELKVTWGYEETNLAINYSFKHGETIIFDLGAEVNGSFTKESINNMTDTVKQTVGGQTSVKITSYPERIINNANAHFQFMDIKFIGLIDFKSLMEDGRNIDNDSTLLEDVYYQKSAEALNKDVKIVAVYASTKEAICKGEAYVTEKQDSVYNYWTEKYTYKTKKVVDFRMVFANGNKVDFEAYFNNGFNDLINSFNDFIDELNTSYGWGIDSIKLKN